MKKTILQAESMTMIMNKAFIFLILLCQVYLSAAQKQTIVKTFDIETFNKNKDHLDNYTYTTKDSTIVVLFDAGGEGEHKNYIEIIKKINEHFQTYSVYFYNGQIRLVGLQFPNDFRKGIWKEYDEEGNLLKETDYDAPFKFTWEDILKVIKERELDMDGYYFEVLRGSSEKATTWTIVWEKEDKTGLNVINIDGVTGEVTREAELEYPAEDNELPDVDIEDDQN